MTEKEYQTNELKRFHAQRYGYFDNIKDFSATLEDADHNLEQIEWIENGSYGAGACLALQLALKGLTPRTNRLARIGSVVLQALYGAPFTKWNKLSLQAQESMNWAVYQWLAKEKHNFAMEVLP